MVVAKLVFLHEFTKGWEQVYRVDYLVDPTEINRLGSFAPTTMVSVFVFTLRVNFLEIVSDVKNRLVVTSR